MLKMNELVVFRFAGGKARGLVSEIRGKRVKLTRVTRIGENIRHLPNPVTRKIHEVEPARSRRLITNSNGSSGIFAALKRIAAAILALLTLRA